MNASLEKERFRWILWIPIALTSGIAGVFYGPMDTYVAFWKKICKLGQEYPFFLNMGWVIGFMGILYYGGRKIKFQNQTLHVKFSPLAVFLLWGLFWTLLGAILMVQRYVHLETVFLNKPWGPGWLEGKIETLDHPASRQRLFQRVVLKLHTSLARDSLSVKKILMTIRSASIPLQEGDCIRLRGMLLPPPANSIPLYRNSSQDFYFRGIGATGFSLSSPELLRSDPTFLQHCRHKITRAIHRHLPAPLGAVACGLVTGDKAALPWNLRKSFSDSGLSHLLAIAGLHLSLLVALCVFWFRWLLSWFSKIFGRHIQTLASLIALSVAWFYMMISGQRIPVQRAFFMMAASFLALHWGRKRDSMRLLMLCGAGMLLMDPELALNLSYQLSFGAVAGLISFYEAYQVRWKVVPKAYRQTAQHFKGWRKSFWRFYRQLYRGKIKRIFNIFQRWMRHHIYDGIKATWIITLVTAPIMAYHFQHISLQGVISNALAIPWTAFVIFPLGILALGSLMTPWSHYFFVFWGYSLNVLIQWAETCSGFLDFLFFPVPVFSPLFLGIQMLGIMWFLIWKKSWRYGGWVVFGLGILGAMHFRPRPVIWVHRGSGRVGFYDAKGHNFYVSKGGKGKRMVQHWQQALAMPKIQSLESAPSLLQKKFQSWIEKAPLSHRDKTWILQRDRKSQPSFSGPFVVLDSGGVLGYKVENSTD